MFGASGAAGVTAQVLPFDINAFKSKKDPPLATAFSLVCKSSAVFSENAKARSLCPESLINQEKIPEIEPFNSCF